MFELSFEQYLLIVIVWFEVARFLMQIYPKLSRFRLRGKGTGQVKGGDDFYRKMFEGRADGQHGAE